MCSNYMNFLGFKMQNKSKENPIKTLAFVSLSASPRATMITRRLLSSWPRHCRTVAPASGHRTFSADVSPEYARRNYAGNLSEYNTVISSLISQRR